MRQSQLFTKTRREDPKDETAKNAKLLIRGGYIHKEMAGVYDYLPLGLMVLKKIEAIIREEMNALGAQELLLTSLQNPALWEASGRFDDKQVDNWFKTHLHNGENFHAGSELGLANTHEEPLAAMLVNHLHSYRDLPIYAYQFQTKFRNELRAKSGIMRGREFLMKDLYSFSRTEEDFRDFYEQCAEAYLRIFARVGLGEVTFRTFASGGSFGDFSDEFQTLSTAGEDIIYLDRERGLAINKEIYNDDILKRLAFDKEKLAEVKAIEVGNIFPLGTRFAEALNLHFIDEDGTKRFPLMGSYGIGLGRLLGTIVEVLSRDDGICWPVAVAPFAVHLVTLPGATEVRGLADDLYQQLTKQGLAVLYDDRPVGAGEKLTDSDLLGLPYRIIVSDRTLAANQLEVRVNADQKTEAVAPDKLVAFLDSKQQK
ncbi:MAG: aminoacyl--tRNA ligase-related protein [Candidatus Paceibacterota bacterium]